MILQYEVPLSNAFSVICRPLLVSQSWSPSILTTYPNIEACVGLPVQYSCENTTVLTDSCCNVVQGGLVLQTQFWDTYTGLESQGQLLPQGSWTIHGLWPDNCDGSYNEYCDLSRQYDPTPSPSTLPDGTVVPPYHGPSVRTFIQDFGRYDLLQYMDEYWINQGAPNENFWAHEFSTHATCTSTFDVACYEPGYQEHQEVVNFYETVTKVFQMYPTYNMLAAAGILPSNTTTYTLSQITNVLYSQTGAVPYLGCYGNGTILDEVWYFHHVLGTEQYGHFKTLNSTTPSSCAETGIWYYERTTTSERVVSY
ncbi:ribonuclease T2 [Suillus subalutaceus]|uniref:ribonuclease T2 n=1 Tax=Suillus subalutaceus TaxID=48586 RepID=UPI001B86C2D9|nr:ribonuclease T2 [Suillus subalutaceus]KAG1850623.1 ribonuclease T2 [Suillus subalutaceus]